MIALTADHPIDQLELAWALEVRRADRPSAVMLASMSGRGPDEWSAAITEGATSAQPEVNAEREAIVHHAILEGHTIATVARFARAPRAWVVKVAQAMPQFSR